MTGTAFTPRSRAAPIPARVRRTPNRGAGWLYRVLASVLLISACGTDDDMTGLAPRTTDLMRAMGDVSLMRYSCYDPSHVECQDTPPPGDPAPNSEGVYLGQYFSWSACIDQGGFDQDGLQDFCEFQLALAFRPLLMFHSDESGTSRETYWAARRAGWSVRIFYALGYHWDYGNDFTISCQLPGAAPYCMPHPGDSEFIELQISFNSTTQHWTLDAGYLSAHHGTPVQASELVLGSSFTYPWIEAPSDTGFAHYPLVWVARDKHANYKTIASCEDGAFASDQCNGGFAERVDIWEARNLGGDDHRYIDQVYSQYPGTYSGHEYFWTSENFCGWDGPSLNHDRANCAGVYGTYLRDFGYNSEPL